MRVSSTVADLRRWLEGWRTEGSVIGLVPTMGNLHEGHAALVRRAQALCDRVIVSVFVNPTQFGAGEDFATYPRTPQDDERLLARLETDLLFRPEAEEIYPFGAEEATRVSVPGLSTILCGASRPGHFDGVAGVVLRLFTIVRPDYAVFGEKDYQQCLLVRRLVTDLHLPLEIVMVPTVRERDGLALSSRNRYLTSTERLRAPRLVAALRRLGARMEAGERDWATLEQEAAAELEEYGFRVEYVRVRRTEDLGAPRPQDPPASLRILAAARLGRTRLIDNLPVFSAVEPSGS